MEWSGEEILNSGWTELRCRSVTHEISGARSFQVERVASEKVRSREMPGTSSSHVVGTR